MIRLHNSELPIERLDRNPVRQTNITDKPLGFWYDINGDWKRYCIESDNLQWIYSYNYEVDTSRAYILEINSVKGIEWVAKTYGDSTRYNVFIKWEKVAEDYDGIEIQNFNKESFTNKYNSWHFSWDCSSGCIWNLARIKLI